MASMIKDMPSAASVMSFYASLSTSVMLFKTGMNQLVPPAVRNYIYSKLWYHYKKSSNLVLLIEEMGNGMQFNDVFAAAETYLNSKIDSGIECLKIFKRPKDTSINVKFARCEKIVDSYDGVEVVWTFRTEEKNNDDSGHDSRVSEKRHFAMSFNKKNKDKILNSYIPYILQKAKDIETGKKVIKLHTLSIYNLAYESINLEHPSTFETLAMDEQLKKAIMEDLDRFVRRKDFYKRVGKAWKRGYLLYGPPGTGKTSLVGAMANYLKFDIYDLELANITSDSDLIKVLLRTGNRSILVIEDIDCSVELPFRTGKTVRKEPQFTLSGLLNFIDGLWSSCGDERIIVFTTNNKDKIDPALLRPGRMDMHISMSYLTRDGFRTLASNYLNISNTHWRFLEIEELIGSMNVTPAEVAEQLMQNDDPDASLRGLSQFLNLKRKRMDDGGGGDHADVSKEGESNGIDQTQPNGKRIKLENEEDELLGAGAGAGVGASEEEEEPAGESDDGMGFSFFD